MKRDKRSLSIRVKILLTAYPFSYESVVSMINKEESLVVTTPVYIPQFETYYFI